jgi:hypothetical protein
LFTQFLNKSVFIYDINAENFKKRGAGMKFEISDRQVLQLLIAARNEYLCLKEQYMENPVNPEGMISLEGIMDTYNCILGQAHREGELAFLELITNEK